MVGRTQTRRTASERNPPDDCSPQGQPWPEHSSWQTLQECCDLYFFGVTRRVLAACRDAVLKLETAADIELQGLKPSGTRCKVLPQRAEMRIALLAGEPVDGQVSQGGLAPLRACHALRQAHCAETHLDGGSDARCNAQGWPVQDQHLACPTLRLLQRKQTFRDALYLRTRYV
jgi:hypothetical protein